MSSADVYKTAAGVYVPVPRLMLAEGHFPGLEVIHVTGRNITIGVNFNPICINGNFPMPQVADAVKIRTKAGNAGDAPGGPGARAIKIEGIITDGSFNTEVIATNGANPGPPSLADYIRILKCTVALSGTYATATARSHVADIVLENAAGTEDWATISALGPSFPRSQTEIGVFTVPLGKKAFIGARSFYFDSVKEVNLVLFVRENILQTDAPFDAMTIISEFGGSRGVKSQDQESVFGPFPALTDVGFMGNVSQATAEVDLEYEIILMSE